MGECGVIDCELTIYPRQKIFNLPQYTNMFSLLYGAITGNEYFSEEDEAPSTSSYSASDDEDALSALSSSATSPASMQHYQQTVRSVTSPPGYSIDTSLRDGLTNKMIGRYHACTCSHVEVVSESIQCKSYKDDIVTLGLSGKENDHRSKAALARTDWPMEIKSEKRRANETTGPCRRRHRSSSP
jgi:hypothetical protein